MCTRVIKIERLFQPLLTLGKGRIPLLQFTYTGMSMMNSSERCMVCESIPCLALFLLLFRDKFVRKKVVLCNHYSIINFKYLVNTALF